MIDTDHPPGPRASQAGPNPACCRCRSPGHRTKDCRISVGSVYIPSVTPKPLLNHDYDDNSYAGGGYTMAREFETLTSNGNTTHGSWVLRKAGKWVDHDGFRNDLAERNAVSLK